MQDTIFPWDIVRYAYSRYLDVFLDVSDTACANWISCPWHDRTEILLRGQVGQYVCREDSQTNTLPPDPPPGLRTQPLIDVRCCT